MPAKKTPASPKPPTPPADDRGYAEYLRLYQRFQVEQLFGRGSGTRAAQLRRRQVEISARWGEAEWEKFYKWETEYLEARGRARRGDEE